MIYYEDETAQKTIKFHRVPSVGVYAEYVVNRMATRNYAWYFSILVLNRTEQRFMDIHPSVHRHTFKNRMFRKGKPLKYFTDNSWMICSLKTPTALC